MNENENRPLQHNPDNRDYDRTDPLTRLLGDRPGKVLVRLLVMSLVVGFTLAWLGLSPRDLFYWAEDLFRSAWANSAEIFGSIIGYVLTGAAVVIPIWLVMRLMAGGRRS